MLAPFSCVRKNIYAAAATRINNKPTPFPRPASLKSYMNIVPAQAGMEGESIATRKGEITFFLQFSHYDLMKNIVKSLNHPNTRRPAVKKRKNHKRSYIIQNTYIYVLRGAWHRQAPNDTHQILMLKSYFWCLEVKLCKHKTAISFPPWRHHRQKYDLFINTDSNAMKYKLQEYPEGIHIVSCLRTGTKAQYLFLSLPPFRWVVYTLSVVSVVPK